MKLLSAILFCICCTGIAKAQTITLNPTDQNGINQALQNGGEIYLNAGVYEITGAINIHSNTVLTGSPDAIIEVSPSSSQWFTGQTGIISCSESLKNVEICGFQIDGNLGALPASFANTPGHDKDCERCILLGGYSNDYADNISIHDMKLYDSFSDGIYLRYTTGAHCYNNIISNCQHEGIFLSVALQSEMYNNQIAGITSDCARLDNCVNCKVDNNIFFSYDGTNNNGAYEHGENGLQVGDAGVSHGYDARNKPTTTTNIEVYGNTFADNGLQAILLDSAALADSANVFVHDNKFIGKDELETSGITFEISNSNPSTIGRSEQIFSSIFDILNLNLSAPVFQSVESNLSATVTQVNEGKSTYTLVFVDPTGLESVKYAYQGNTTEHNIEYQSWKGSIPHQADSLFITGVVDQSLKITCYTNTTYFVIKNFNVVKKEQPATLFNPLLFWIFLFIAPWLALAWIALKKIFTFSIV